MVVRLDAGKDAVRAYVHEQAGQGLAHVRQVLAADRDTIAALIGDLSEEEGGTAPEPGEWSIAQVLVHLNSSFERSLARLRTLSSGQPWLNPPATPGQFSDPGDRPFGPLRDEFLEGTNGILAALDEAEPGIGLDLTSEHAAFGPFNWLEWAIYSHHVHTHDHIGQIRETREKVRKEA